MPGLCPVPGGQEVWLRQALLPPNLRLGGKVCPGVHRVGKERARKKAVVVTDGAALSRDHVYSLNKHLSTACRALFEYLGYIGKQNKDPCSHARGADIPVMQTISSKHNA